MKLKNRKKRTPLLMLLLGILIVQLIFPLGTRKVFGNDPSQSLIKLETEYNKVEFFSGEEIRVKIKVDVSGHGTVTKPSVKITIPYKHIEGSLNYSSINNKENFESIDHIEDKENGNYVLTIKYKKEFIGIVDIPANFSIKHKQPITPNGFITPIKMELYGNGNANTPLGTTELPVKVKTLPIGKVSKNTDLVKAFADKAAANDPTRTSSNLEELTSHKWHITVPFQSEKVNGQDVGIEVKGFKIVDTLPEGLEFDDKNKENKGWNYDSNTRKATRIITDAEAKELYRPISPYVIWLSLYTKNPNVKHGTKLTNKVEVTAGDETSEHFHEVEIQVQKEEWKGKLTKSTYEGDSLPFASNLAETDFHYSIRYENQSKSNALEDKIIEIQDEPDHEKYTIKSFEVAPAGIQKINLYRDKIKISGPHMSGDEIKIPDEHQGKGTYRLVFKEPVKVSNDPNAASFVVTAKYRFNQTFIDKFTMKDLPVKNIINKATSISKIDGIEYIAKAESKTHLDKQETGLYTAILENEAPTVGQETKMSSYFHVKKSPTVMTNPSLIVLLPKGFEYVKGSSDKRDHQFDQEEKPFADPEELPNFKGTGLKALKYKVEGNVKETKMLYKITPTAAAEEGINDVATFLTWENNNEVFPDEKKVEYIDVLDLDDDKDTTEVFMKYTVQVKYGLEEGMHAIKTVSKDKNGIYEKGTLSEKLNGLEDTAFYNIRIYNNGTAPISDLIVIDVLPHLGDKSVAAVNHTYLDRESEFQVALTEKITPPNNIYVKVFYSTELPEDDYTKKFNATWIGADEFDFTKLDKVRMVKFEVSDINTKEQVDINYQVKAVGEIDGTEELTAYNSFATGKKGDASEGRESNKVGIVIGTGTDPVIPVNPQGNIDITATKKWVGGTTDSHTEVELTLMNGETAVETKTTADGKVTWNVAKTDADGVDIAYTVKEKTVIKNYTAKVEGNIEKGFTVTNTYKQDDPTTDPVIPGDTSEKIDIKATKVWKDVPEGTSLPASIELTLMNGTTKVRSQTVNAENSWTATWNVDKTDASGQEIAYTVKEVAVPANYTVVVSGNITAGFTVTNTYIPSTTDPEGTTAPSTTAPVETTVPSITDPTGTTVQPKPSGITKPTSPSDQVKAPTAGEASPAPKNRLVKTGETANNVLLIFIVGLMSVLLMVVARKRYQK